tara:strand:- start:1862 stop:2575 length:714 start_codon:yes stop_codon:yes gene_type:complete
MGMHKRETTPFLQILGSTGDFRQTVDKETPGAKFREYETSDGKKGSKYELAFDMVDGMIEKIAFHDGDFGKNLLIKMNFEDDSEGVTIAVGCSTPFGEDFMKKMPAIDFSKRIEITPYSLEDGDKTRKGVSLKQDGEKIKNFFYDGENDTNGYPVAEDDTSKYDTDDWKIHFTKCRKFLVKYLEENIMPKFADVVTEAEKTEAQQNAEFEGTEEVAETTVPSGNVATPSAATEEAKA